MIKLQILIFYQNYISLLWSEIYKSYLTTFKKITLQHYFNCSILYLFIYIPQYFKNRMEKIEGSLQLKNILGIGKSDQNNTSIFKLSQTVDKKKREYTQTKIPKQTKYEFYNKSILGTCNNKITAKNQSKAQSEQNVNSDCMKKSQICLRQQYSNTLSNEQQKYQRQRSNGVEKKIEEQKAALILQQRLKNLHCFYKIRINEEKQKTAEKNKVIMSIIDELQEYHLIKVKQLQKMIAEKNQQKKQFQNVVQRIEAMKEVINEIVSQSEEIKSSNQQLESYVFEKQKRIKEKQEECEILKKNVESLRDQLQNGQKAKIKQVKIKKQMMIIIESMPKTEVSENDFQSYL